MKKDEEGPGARQRSTSTQRETVMHHTETAACVSPHCDKLFELETATYFETATMFESLGFTFC